MQCVDVGMHTIRERPCVCRGSCTVADAGSGPPHEDPRQGTYHPARAPSEALASTSVWGASCPIEREVVDADIRLVNVEDLHFDPENPRIPKHLDAQDEQAVLGWMLEDAGLVELMGSIAAKGYFPAEPILVTRAQGEPGYWVLEGNRRLAAITLLLEPHRAPKRKNAVAMMAASISHRSSLQRLPCVEFAHRNEVLDYLGYRHITGIKQWEPLAKARYLRSLFDEHRGPAGPDVYKVIARLIGSRSDYVMRLLVSLRIYETIGTTDAVQNIDEEDISFSLLTLSLNYKSIVDYLGLESLSQDAFDSVDRDHLENLAGWLYAEVVDIGRTQLGESRNMKLLAAALNHAAGIEALLHGQVVEDAARATLDPDELLARSLSVARDRLLNAQAQVHRALVSDLTVRVIDEISDLVDEVGAAARRRRRRLARDEQSSRGADV